MSKVRLHQFENGSQYAIDEETGEVLGEVGPDGKVIYVPRYEKRAEGWIQLEQIECSNLANSGISLTEMRVLLMCLHYMQYENWVDVSAVRLGNDLGIAASHVSKAFKNLREKGYVNVITNGCCDKRKRVSPALAWKGSVTNARKAIAAELDGTKYNGKCICGSILHTNDQDESDRWSEDHRQCQ